MECIFSLSGVNHSASGLHSFSLHSQLNSIVLSKNMNQKRARNRQHLILCCSHSSPSVISASSVAPPVIRKRKRYRRQYPGESEGITEEMRFVAMRLRNFNGKKVAVDNKSDSEDENSAQENDTWKPSMEGFLNFLVDSKLVFHTVERIVDESNDVAYAYFRKTGLERSEGLSADIEWFSQQGFLIPEPSNPGVSYAKYLEELAERSAPLFLSHFYNIYFSHIAGGQVIARKVSEELLDGRELEFYRWNGDTQELMKNVREKLNMLGEHWSRDEKNKCLKEATKSFRFLGQIVRLIILW